MGAALSSGSSENSGPASQKAAWLAPTTPRPGQARKGSNANGVNTKLRTQSTTGPCVGSIGAAENGAITWTVSGASLAEALGHGGVENGERTSAASDATNGEPAAAPAACVSPAFSIPPASLPASCAGLLAAHRWQLVAELAGAHPLTPTVSLRWLGGPGPQRTDGMSVCAEFLLALRRAAAPGGPGSERPALAERHWLLHAFNDSEPEAGLPGALPAGGPVASSLAGLVLETQLRFEGLAMHVQAPLPALVAHEAPLVLKVSEDPCLLVVERFLSPHECAAVRRLGQPHLKRSKVSSGDETSLRTSSGMFITGALQQDPVSCMLDDRVRQLAQLACRLEGRKALTLGEATQIVRYDVGQYYALHLDNRAGDCAKRAVTVMVYLADVEAGGATSFPRSTGMPLHRALGACTAGYRNEPAPPYPHAAARPPRDEQERPEGLRVLPREGRAIVFWSRMPDGEEDKCSLHEAEKVLAGTKWIATRWCREEP